MGNFNFWLVSLHIIYYVHILHFDVSFFLNVIVLLVFMTLSCLRYVHVRTEVTLTCSHWSHPCDLCICFQCHATLLHLHSGGIPYRGIVNSLIGTAICNGEVMGKPENCSSDMWVHHWSACPWVVRWCNLLTVCRYATMCKCWQMMPADRPTFTELRSHFEGLLEGQHASNYIDFTASLAPISVQEEAEDNEMDNLAADIFT